MMALQPHTLLGDPVRVRALTRVVRAKIPASDVEDVVQSILADALAATDSPPDIVAFDRWLHGIARHKIADYYRRHRRHEVLDPDALERDAHSNLNAGATSPESARDLLRWVDAELPRGAEAPRTLEWMLREASGDRLETIAEEHALPAPAVRQRVSRLRRYLRERWALQLAAALGLCVVATGIYAHRRYYVPPTIHPDLAQHEVTAVERARQIRQAALEACKASQWQSCLDELERAKRLDAVGDAANEVQQARVSAANALQPPPAPAPPPSTSAQPAPSPSVPPVKSEPVKQDTDAQPVKRAPIKAPATKKAPLTNQIQNDLLTPSLDQRGVPLQKPSKRKNAADFQKK